MARNNLRIYLAASIIGLACLISGSRASAANQTPSGITISPAIAQINISSNETEHPLEFSLTNNRTVTQNLKLSGADFNTLEESGGLIFVGTNPTQLQKKYGLVKWLSIPDTSVSVLPKQTIIIKAAILNQPDLAAGGHYGALMISLDNGDSPGQPNKISLDPVASLLLFVNKIGGDIHNLSLDKVDAVNNVFSLPSQVALHFRNQGNTHVLPRGTVEIHDSGGRLISKGVINQDSAIILPELSRNFQVKLAGLALPKRPGHYLLSVNYRFDGYPNYKTYQKSLFLLTPLGLIFFVAGIGGLLGLVYLFNKNRLPKWPKK